MSWTDKELGMDRPITRRDFMNGAAMALAAAITPKSLFGQEAQDRPGYDPPAAHGLRGSHAGAFEVAQIVHARDGGREIVLNELLLLPRPESGEDQNAFADASFAQFDAFVRAGDAIPVHAGLLERFRNGHRAESIRVRFHDRQNFGLRPHVTANRAKIFQDCLQRNLHPYRASADMNFFRHVHLECQTLWCCATKNRAAYALRTVCVNIRR